MPMRAMRTPGKYEPVLSARDEATRNCGESDKALSGQWSSTINYPIHDKRNLRNNLQMGPFHIFTQWAECRQWRT
jgi:hypothetical protein